MDRKILLFNNIVKLSLYKFQTLAILWCNEKLYWFYTNHFLHFNVTAVDNYIFYWLQVIFHRVHEHINNFTLKILIVFNFKDIKKNWKNIVFSFGSLIWKKWIFIVHVFEIIKRHICINDRHNNSLINFLFYLERWMS